MHTIAYKVAKHLKNKTICYCGALWEDRSCDTIAKEEGNSLKCFIETYFFLKSPNTLVMVHKYIWQVYCRMPCLNRVYCDHIVVICCNCGRDHSLDHEYISIYYVNDDIY